MQTRSAVGDRTILVCERAITARARGRAARERSLIRRPRTRAACGRLPHVGIALERRTGAFPACRSRSQGVRARFPPGDRVRGARSGNSQTGMAPASPEFARGGSREPALRRCPYLRTVRWCDCCRVRAPANCTDAPVAVATVVAEGLWSAAACGLELVEQRLFRAPTLVAVRTREPSYRPGHAHASPTARRRRLPSTAAGPAQVACRLGGQ